MRTLAEPRTTSSVALARIQAVTSGSRPYLSVQLVPSPLTEASRAGSVRRASASATPASAAPDAHADPRRGAHLGALESGKIADVLVVDGDPLAGLQALQQVRLVIKGGEVIRRGK